MPSTSDEDLLELYRQALAVRLLDERLEVLGRAGRIGYHPPSLGAEVVIVAAAKALQANDWLVPTPRDHGAAFVRGASFEAYLDHVVGNEADVTRGHGTPGTFCSRALRIASPSVQVSQHLTHAAGLAWAVKLRKAPEAVLAFLHETACDAGDFHSAVNFAGVTKAPIVFLIKTDGREAPAPAVELAERGVAYGVEARSVGDDPIAVLEAVRTALTKAREGHGPTLLEVRISGSSDGLGRLGARLTESGRLDELADFALRRDLHVALEAATQAALTKAAPQASTLFDDVRAARAHEGT